LKAIQHQQYNPVSQQSSYAWHTLSARIKKTDLPILNKKLEMNGFKTLNEFVHA
jgi:hypothetical protein